MIPTKMRKARTAVLLAGILSLVQGFRPLAPTALRNPTLHPQTENVVVPLTTLFGKKAARKNKGGGGKGGGKPRGQQQRQEKQSVQEQRFDAATRQFMFTMVGLTKMLPDKSKNILKNINLSFYPGAKIGVVGLNGSVRKRNKTFFFLHKTDTPTDLLIENVIGSPMKYREE